MIRAIVLGALLAAVSGAAPIPENGRVAFATTETATPQGLVSIAPAGGAPVVIDAGAVNDGIVEIVPSPDGSRFAYATRDSIYVARADGRGRTKLADGIRLSWAPDGRRLVYQGPEGEVGIAAVDGGGRRDLGVTGGYPTWSPNGRWIAFVDANTSRVEAIRPDGTGRRTVAEGAAGTPIAWSPSGEWLTFGATVGDKSSLSVARLDGSGLRAVGFDRFAAWAPTDDLLAAWGESGLRIQTPDGRSVVAVTNVGAAGAVGAVAWSPGGRSIAVGEHSGALVVVDARTGTSRSLGLRGLPAWSPDGTQLAYSRGGALWTIPAKGGAPRLVTRGGVGRPVWLDGGRIVVFREVRARWVIATVTPRGGDRRTLIEAPAGSDGFVELAWSPTGSHLAYVSDPERSHRLEIVAAGGGRPRVVATSAGRPAWSPDGRQIVYVRGGVYILRLDEQRPRRLTRAGDRPAWSPDGRHVAFIRAADGPVGALYVVRTSGGTPRRLVSDGVHSFSWSPDGRRIAFDAEDGFEIASIGVDGKGRRRLVAGDRDEETGVIVSRPKWSPDARKIAYSSEQLLCGTRCSEHFLEVVSPTGRRLALIPDPNYVRDFEWSPDGTRLVGIDGTNSVVSLDPLRLRSPPRTIARFGIAASWQPLPRRR